MDATPQEFSRLNLYTVLDGLPDGVTLADTEGTIVFSNRAADEILGVGAATDAAPEEWSEYYGAFLPDGVTPFPTDQYPLVRALAGERTHDVEMLIRNPTHPDGALISVSGRQLRDEDGHPIGAAVVFRDITEVRRAERLKDELGAFIVHDLKSPLATIIATCDLLSLDPLDDPVREDVLTIRGAAWRVNRMLLDLLDIQLAEDGALDVNLTKVALGDLLSEVRDAAIGRVGRRAAHRIVVGEPDALSLFADRALLYRVLINLVDNCIKYGPNQGTIWIDARAEAGVVSITVEDEGPGVPLHLRERVFEKYAQCEREEGYRSKDSRGLGLRFCWVVAQAHGGRIWVEDGEPSGARFCLELPAS